MLPRLLCEELCSLNPLTDRLTFSVIWKITPEGKVPEPALRHPYSTRIRQHTSHDDSPPPPSPLL